MRIDGKDPFGGLYGGVELQWYGEDTPEKRQQAVQWLDKVQYINLTSNRLYLSIPRLPLRFPMTTKYYEALFDGSLGFEPVATFTSRPQLFGIEINDDDAEESFTVYDHPKVIIFQKTPAYSHANTEALFAELDLYEYHPPEAAGLHPVARRLPDGRRPTRPATTAAAHGPRFSTRPTSPTACRSSPGWSCWRFWGWRSSRWPSWSSGALPTAALPWRKRWACWPWPGAPGPWPATTSWRSAAPASRSCSWR